MKATSSLVTAASMLLAAGATVAHHSAAMFDYSRVVVLTGTVKSFKYQAPHSWVSIIGAPGDGTSARQWDAETGSPSRLKEMGISRETLQPGDKVTMGVYPLRDGRAAGALIYITNADGKTFGTKTEKGAP